MSVIERMDAARLTPLERQVALCAAHGQPTKEIARDLGIAARCVKGHLTAIYAKTRATNRVELLRYLLGAPVIRDAA